MVLVNSEKIVKSHNPWCWMLSNIVEVMHCGGQVQKLRNIEGGNDTAMLRHCKSNVNFTVYSTSLFILPCSNKINTAVSNYCASYRDWYHHKRCLHDCLHWLCITCVRFTDRRLIDLTSDRWKEHPSIASNKYVPKIKQIFLSKLKYSKRDIWIC